MHASALENMLLLYRRFIAGAYLEARGGLEVLDVGGRGVDGSYRNVFVGPGVAYRVADTQAGEGVDLVLEDPCQIPLEDGSVDVVVCGQAFERREFFWRAFEEMVRVVKDDGFVFLIAPSAGPVHRDPVDCYRFQPDAFAALARHAGCHLIDCWRDERGPWKEVVGAFRRTPMPAGFVPRLAATGVPLALFAPAAPADGRIPAGSAEQEATGGAEPYIQALGRLHQQLRPELYLEIGIRAGGSLRLATGRAIGVDPDLSLAGDFPASTTVFPLASDDFFRDEADRVLDRPVDLAFIDGLHLFEYVLRDFMNVERRAARHGLVVVDDIFPNHPDQSSRDRKTRVWTGDVWRLMACLSEHRPDLILLPIDTAPTGLLLIAGLDPDNRTLWEDYNPIVRRFLHDLPPLAPEGLLRRADAIAPGAPVVDLLLATLRNAAATGADPDRALEKFRPLYRFPTA